MSHPLKSLFEKLLAQQELSLVLQKRIHQYAVNRKDFYLLKSLAAHPALSEEIDEKIKEHPSAIVKAAWISRPGRSASDIEGLVSHEKRVTILTALAEMECLSNEAQRIIVAKSKNKTVLVAIIRNSKSSIENRKFAANELIKLNAEQSSDLGLDVHRIQNATDTHHMLDGFLFEHVSSGCTDLSILFAASGCMEIPDSVKNLLVNGFLSKYSKALQSPMARYSEGTNAQSQLVTLASNLAEHGEVDVNLRTVLDKALEDLLALAPSDGWSHNKIALVREELKNANGARYRDITQRLCEIDSIEAMQRLVEQINKLNQNRDLSNSFLNATAFSIISSEFSTPEMMNVVHDWLAYSNYNDAILRADTIEKQVSLIEEMTYWVDLNFILDKCSDRDGLLDLLLQRCAIKPHIIRTLLDCNHFKPEYLRRIPLSILVNSDLSDNLIEQLQLELNSVLEDENAWTLIESLSDEFEGSLEELLNVAKTL